MRKTQKHQITKIQQCRINEKPFVFIVNSPQGIENNMRAKTLKFIEQYARPSYILKRAFTENVNISLYREQFQIQTDATRGPTNRFTE